MSDILVENKIVMRPINTIKPYIRNPRSNSKTVKMLMEMIPKVGSFNVPLVIDENGVIVKGHARFVAAIRLGMKEVPCVITHADPEAIKADRIADNKIFEFSEWTNELQNEINDLDFDLSDLGLPKVELDDVQTQAEMQNALSSISEEKKEQLYEEFKKEQEQAQAKVGSQMTNISVEEFDNVPYYRCVCEKCGFVIFIREGE